MLWVIVWIFATLLFIKIYNWYSAGKCYARNYMVGKVVIVTGANSGIGFETALNLARRGAKVILACRDKAKGQQAVDAIKKTLKRSVKIRYQHLDLSSLDSVREFVEEFKKNEAKLDVLINNAGASGVGGKKTADGIIRDMQVNHFGPFLLTLLLVPLLKKASPSRIINVSSFLHKFGTTDDINIEDRYGTFQIYCNSKLCNVLFTNELARRLEGSGIAVNSLHPGQVNTTFYRNSKIFEKLRSLVLYTFFKSPKEGAQTSIYLAVSDDCDQTTGKYFADCEESRMSYRAEDQVLATELWSISEELVGLRRDEILCF